MGERKLYADRPVRAGAGEVCKRQVGSHNPGIGESDRILPDGSTREIKSRGKINIGGVTARLGDQLHYLNPLLFDFSNGLIFHPRGHEKRQKAGEGKHDRSDNRNVEKKLDEGKAFRTFDI